MPRRSSLAWLQRAVTATVLAAALVWLLFHWPDSPLLAIAGAIGLLLWHAWILALEFLFLRWAGQEPSVPRPSWVQLLRVWAREVVDAVRVFGWRQPFAWRAVPDAPSRATGDHCGIVFIHGFVCNRGFWTPWLRESIRRGHPFIAVNLEPVFGSIDAYVGTIEEAVATLTRETGRAPALVCHSMGGLAARAWLRACGDAVRAAHVVTIASPHAGTWLARFSQTTNGHQMRMGGRWLAQLEAAEPRARERFTCWYTNCDNIVFPPSVATLPGADNRFVAHAAHVDLAFRADVMQGTFERLACL